ncbi:MAG: hypothetical protein QOI50_7300 [Pseudonocardiales bacterium]|nr:hypothetical protein [Pseudonocardiales bacterium]
MPTDRSACATRYRRSGPPINRPATPIWFRRAPSSLSSPRSRASSHPGTEWPPRRAGGPSTSWQRTSWQRTSWQRPPAGPLRTFSPPRRASARWPITSVSRRGPNWPTLPPRPARRWLPRPARRWPPPARRHGSSEPSPPPAPARAPAAHRAGPRTARPGRPVTRPSTVGRAGQVRQMGARTRGPRRRPGARDGPPREPGQRGSGRPECGRPAVGRRAFRDSTGAATGGAASGRPDRGGRSTSVGPLRTGRHLRGASTCPAGSRAWHPARAMDLPADRPVHRPGAQRRRGLGDRHAGWARARRGRATQVAAGVSPLDHRRHRRSGPGGQSTTDGAGPCVLLSTSIHCGTSGDSWTGHG